jgi:hypothetical protein
LSRFQTGTEKSMRLELNLKQKKQHRCVATAFIVTA